MPAPFYREAAVQRPFWMLPLAALALAQLISPAMAADAVKPPTLAKVTTSEGDIYVGELKQQNDTSVTIINLKTGHELKLNMPKVLRVDTDVSDDAAAKTIGLPPLHAVEPSRQWRCHGRGVDHQTSERWSGHRRTIPTDCGDHRGGKSEHRTLRPQNRPESRQADRRLGGPDRQDCHERRDFGGAYAPHQSRNRRDHPPRILATGSNGCGGSGQDTGLGGRGRGALRSLP